VVSLVLSKSSSFLYYVSTFVPFYPVQHLIHIQGTGDNFYKQGQLLPENFEAAARDAGIDGLKVRYQPDYDHSYYTMATFADDHVEHAAKYLLA
jgi:S-formylglutathione hydrolase